MKIATTQQVKLLKYRGKEDTESLLLLLCIKVKETFKVNLG